MGKLYNMKAAFSLAQTLYGLNDLNESEFEDLALNGWELIGNKHTRLYRYTADTVNQELELPCNTDIIESVNLNIPEVQLTSPDSSYISHNNIYAEHYIDAWNHFDSVFHNRGKLIKYKEENNTLYFDKDYHNVTVVYHGVMADEDGLPLINDKEMKAIAAYVAYASLYKEGIRKRDQSALTLAQSLQAEWLRKCNAARIPEKFSQNDMDQILDVATRWDRKHYSKSIKPIL